MPRSKAKVPAADFCYQMEWEGYLVNDPDYFYWSHFGLQGPDGKFRLFGERVASETIRKFKAHIAWRLCKCAELTHYTADHPEGPWKMMEQPAFQQPNPGKKGRHVTVEDVGAFGWNDRVYLLLSDYFGHVTGVVGGLALFVSEDGLSFPFEQARLAADLIPAYYKAYDPRRAMIWWDPALPNRLETPRVMLTDGRPAYFLAGSGTNVDGGPTTASYLLKILT